MGLIASAQTKLTFETDAIGTTTNAVALWDGGSVDVMANPYSTGINTSTKVLHVMNNNYCAVYLKVALPAGTKTAYPYLTVKYKLCYVGPNGGTDLNYPNTDFYSIPSATTTYADAEPAMKFANAIGWGGSVSWGTPTVGTWVQCGFTFSSSTLTDIPAGYLVIKIAKPKLEYLIDDVELVPSPLYSTNILTVENFESKTIDEVLTTTGSGATASVKADPADAAKKSAYIVPTAYGNYLRLSVALPTGRVLSDYDRLYYDRYIVATSTAYKQFSIKANTTTIYADEGYPSLGTNNTWQYKDVDLSALDLTAVGNAFNLDLGINSDGTGPVLTYYLDNIKLHLKDAITGLQQSEINPLFIYSTANAFVLNQTVDSYELYSMQGSRVANGQNASSINTSNLRNGIYILKAVVDGEIFKVKISK